ncbi:hypothetical protein DL764_010653 [Monosporascus ibericus]|uniref:Uncharacterized protein n=1 Tax=Monosporascus ibericus TaxID=155417 RepID=A0A4Q4SUU4_9PEZI|nr:hypothetical protein DL764_010653 [Monosporascus ibericus]
MFSSIAHWDSTWDLSSASSPSLFGGTRVIVPCRLRGGPAAISKLIAQEIITHTGATPSEYSSWQEYGFPNLSGRVSVRNAVVAASSALLR